MSGPTLHAKHMARPQRLNLFGGHHGGQRHGGGVSGAVPKNVMMSDFSLEPMPLLTLPEKCVTCMYSYNDRLYIGTATGHLISYIMHQNDSHRSHFTHWSDIPSHVSSDNDLQQQQSKTSIKSDNITKQPDYNISPDSATFLSPPPPLNLSSNINSTTTNIPSTTTPSSTQTPITFQQSSLPFPSVYKMTHLHTKQICHYHRALPASAAQISKARFGVIQPIGLNYPTVSTPLCQLPSAIVSMSISHQYNWLIVQCNQYIGIYDADTLDFIERILSMPTQAVLSNSTFLQAASRYPRSGQTMLHERYQGGMWTSTNPKEYKMIIQQYKQDYHRILTIMKKRCQTIPSHLLDIQLDPLDHTILSFFNAYGDLTTTNGRNFEDEIEHKLFFAPQYITFRQIFEIRLKHKVAQNSLSQILNIPISHSNTIVYNYHMFHTYLQQLSQYLSSKRAQRIQTSLQSLQSSSSSSLLLQDNTLGSPTTIPLPYSPSMNHLGSSPSMLPSLTELPSSDTLLSSPNMGPIISLSGTSSATASQWTTPTMAPMGSNISTEELHGIILPDHVMNMYHSSNNTEHIIHDDNSIDDTHSKGGQLSSSPSTSHSSSSGRPRAPSIIEDNVGYGSPEISSTSNNSNNSGNSSSSSISSGINTQSSHLQPSYSSLDHSQSLSSISHHKRLSSLTSSGPPALISPMIGPQGPTVALTPSQIGQIEAHHSDIASPTLVVSGDSMQDDSILPALAGLKQEAAITAANRSKLPPGAKGAPKQRQQTQAAKKSQQQTQQTSLSASHTVSPLAVSAFSHYYWDGVLHFALVSEGHLYFYEAQNATPHAKNAPPQSTSTIAEPNHMSSSNQSNISANQSGPNFNSTNVSAVGPAAMLRKSSSLYQTTTLNSFISQPIMNPQTLSSKPSLANSQSSAEAGHTNPDSFLMLASSTSSSDNTFATTDSFTEAEKRGGLLNRITRMAKGVVSSSNHDQYGTINMARDKMAPQLPNHSIPETLSNNNTTGSTTIVPPALTPHHTSLGTDLIPRPPSLPPITPPKSVRTIVWKLRTSYVLQDIPLSIQFISVYFVIISYYNNIIIFNINDGISRTLIDLSLESLLSSNMNVSNIMKRSHNTTRHSSSSSSSSSMTTSSVAASIPSTANLPLRTNTDPTQDMAMPQSRNQPSPQASPHIAARSIATGDESTSTVPIYNAPSLPNHSLFSYPAQPRLGPGSPALNPISIASPANLRPIPGPMVGSIHHHHHSSRLGYQSTSMGAGTAALPTTAGHSLRSPGPLSYRDPHITPSVGALFSLGSASHIPASHVMSPGHHALASVLNNNNSISASDAYDSIPTLVQAPITVRYTMLPPPERHQVRQKKHIQPPSSPSSMRPGSASSTSLSAVSSPTFSAMSTQSSSLSLYDNKVTSPNTQSPSPQSIDPSDGANLESLLPTLILPDLQLSGRAAMTSTTPYHPLLPSYNTSPLLSLAVPSRYEYLLHHILSPHVDHLSDSVDYMTRQLQAVTDYYRSVYADDYLWFNMNHNDNSINHDNNSDQSLVIPSTQHPPISPTQSGLAPVPSSSNTTKSSVLVSSSSTLSSLVAPHTHSSVTSPLSSHADGSSTISSSSSYTNQYSPSILSSPHDGHTLNKQNNNHININNNHHIDHETTSTSLPYLPLPDYPSTDDDAYIPLESGGSEGICLTLPSIPPVSYTHINTVFGLVPQPDPTRPLIKLPYTKLPLSTLLAGALMHQKPTSREHIATSYLHLLGPCFNSTLTQMARIVETPPPPIPRSTQNTKDSSSLNSSTIPISPNPSNVTSPETPTQPSDDSSPNQNNTFQYGIFQPHITNTIKTLDYIDRLMQRMDISSKTYPSIHVLNTGEISIIISDYMFVIKDLNLDYSNSSSIYNSDINFTSISGLDMVIDIPQSNVNNNSNQDNNNTNTNNNTTDQYGSHYPPNYTSVSTSQASSILQTQQTLVSSSSYIHPSSPFDSPITAKTTTTKTKTTTIMVTSTETETVETSFDDNQETKHIYDDNDDDGILNSQFVPAEASMHSINSSSFVPSSLSSALEQQSRLPRPPLAAPQPPPTHYSSAPSSYDPSPHTLSTPLKLYPAVTPLLPGAYSHPQSFDSLYISHPLKLPGKPIRTSIISELQANMLRNWNELSTALHYTVNKDDYGETSHHHHDHGHIHGGHDGNQNTQHTGSSSSSSALPPLTGSHSSYDNKMIGSTGTTNSTNTTAIGSTGTANGAIVTAGSSGVSLSSTQDNISLSPKQSSMTSSSSYTHPTTTATSTSDQYSSELVSSHHSLALPPNPLVLSSLPPSLHHNLTSLPPSISSNTGVYILTMYEDQQPHLFRLDATRTALPLPIVLPSTLRINKVHHRVTSSYLPYTHDQYVLPPHAMTSLVYTSILVSPTPSETPKEAHEKWAHTTTQRDIDQGYVSDYGGDGLSSTGYGSSLPQSPHHTVTTPSSLLPQLTVPSLSPQLTASSSQLSTSSFLGTYNRLDDPTHDNTRYYSNGMPRLWVQADPRVNPDLDSDLDDDDSTRCAALDEEWDHMITFDPSTIPSLQESSSNMQNNERKSKLWFLGKKKKDKNNTGGPSDHDNNNIPPPQPFSLSNHTPSGQHNPYNRPNRSESAIRQSMMLEPALPHLSTGAVYAPTPPVPPGFLLETNVGDDDLFTFDSRQSSSQLPTLPNQDTDTDNPYSGGHNFGVMPSGSVPQHSHIPIFSSQQPPALTPSYLTPSPLAQDPTNLPQINISLLNNDSVFDHPEDDVDGNVSCNANDDNCSGITNNNCYDGSSTNRNASPLALIRRTFSRSKSPAYVPSKKASSGPPLSTSPTPGFPSILPLPPNGPPKKTSSGPPLSHNRPAPPTKRHYSWHKPQSGYSSIQNVNFELSHPSSDLTLPSIDITVPVTSPCLLNQAYVDHKLSRPQTFTTFMVHVPFTYTYTLTHMQLISFSFLEPFTPQHTLQYHPEGGATNDDQQQPSGQQGQQRNTSNNNNTQQQILSAIANTHIAYSPLYPLLWFKYQIWMLAPTLSSVDNSTSFLSKLSRHKSWENLRLSFIQYLTTTLSDGNTLLGRNIQLFCNYLCQQYGMLVMCQSYYMSTASSLSNNDDNDHNTSTLDDPTTTPLESIVDHSLGDISSRQQQQNRRTTVTRPQCNHGNKPIKKKKKKTSFGHIFDPTSLYKQGFTRLLKQTLYVQGACPTSDEFQALLDHCENEIELYTLRICSIISLKWSLDTYSDLSNLLPKIVKNIILISCSSCLMPLFRLYNAHSETSFTRACAIYYHMAPRDHDVGVFDFKPDPDDDYFNALHITLEAQKVNLEAQRASMLNNKRYNEIIHQNSDISGTLPSMSSSDQDIIDKDINLNDNTLTTTVSHDNSQQQRQNIQSPTLSRSSSSTGPESIISVSDEQHQVQAFSLSTYAIPVPVQPDSLSPKEIAMFRPAIDLIRKAALIERPSDLLEALLEISIVIVDCARAIHDYRSTSRQKYRDYKEKIQQVIQWRYYRYRLIEYINILRERWDIIPGKELTRYQLYGNIDQRQQQQQPSLHDQSLLSQSQHKHQQQEEIINDIDPVSCSLPAPQDAQILESISDTPIVPSLENTVSDPILHHNHNNTILDGCNTHDATATLTPSPIEYEIVDEIVDPNHNTADLSSSSSSAVVQEHNHITHCVCTPLSSLDPFVLSLLTNEGYQLDSDILTFILSNAVYTIPQCTCSHMKSSLSEASTTVDSRPIELSLVSLAPPLSSSSSSSPTSPPNKSSSLSPTIPSASSPDYIFSHIFPPHPTTYSQIRPFAIGGDDLIPLTVYCIIQANAQLDSISVQRDNNNTSPNNNNDQSSSSSSSLTTYNNNGLISSPSRLTSELLTPTVDALAPTPEQAGLPHLTLSRMHYCLMALTAEDRAGRIGFAATTVHSALNYIAGLPVGDDDKLSHISRGYNNNNDTSSSYANDNVDKNNKDDDLYTNTRLNIVHSNNDVIYTTSDHTSPSTGGHPSGPRDLLHKPDQPSFDSLPRGTFSSRIRIGSVRQRIVDDHTGQLTTSPSIPEDGDDVDNDNTTSISEEYIKKQQQLSLKHPRQSRVDGSLSSSPSAGLAASSSSLGQTQRPRIIGTALFQNYMNLIEDYF